MERGDEVDDGILATRREASPLDPHPAFARDRAESVVVVLAVATVMVGDTAHERLERKPWRPVAPSERERARKPRVVGLREDDRTATRAEHRSGPLRRTRGVHDPGKRPVPSDPGRHSSP